MRANYKLQAYVFFVIILFTNIDSFCQSQVKKEIYYLDFFGRKYGLDTLKKNLYDGNSGIRLITPVNKVIKIKFCGKKILERYGITVLDPWNPNSSINEMKYNFSPCINWPIIDSIKISSLSKDSVFIFIENNKKYSIYSFKIISDSSEVECEYINNYIASDREDFNARFYSMEPSKRLMEIIEKNNNSTKFLIKEIYCYNTITKERHKTNFGILLYH